MYHIQGRNEDTDTVFLICSTSLQYLNAVLHYSILNAVLCYSISIHSTLLQYLYMQYFTTSEFTIQSKYCVSELQYSKILLYMSHISFNCISVVRKRKCIVSVSINSPAFFFNTVCKHARYKDKEPAENFSCTMSRYNTLSWLWSRSRVILHIMMALM